MKGISGFMSHVIAIAIAFVVLSMISVNMYDYYTNTVKETQKTQAKILGQKIGLSITKLYETFRNSDFEPNPGENFTFSELEITVPKQISGKAFSLELRENEDFWIWADIKVDGQDVKLREIRKPSNRIFIQTFEEPETTFTFDLYNIEIPVEGEFRQTDKVKFSYLRTNQNGKIKDKIIMERV